MQRRQIILNLTLLYHQKKKLKQRQQRIDSLLRVETFSGINLGKDKWPYFQNCT